MECLGGRARRKAGDQDRICHRTASHTNPYVQITVDQSAIFNNGIVPNGHGTHTGPVFPSVGPDGKWGDIIPAFDGYPGQNLTAQGLAILNNGCKVPGPPTTTTPPTSPPTSPPTTSPSAPTTTRPGVSAAQAAAAARFFAALQAQAQARAQAAAAAPVVGAPRTTG